MLEEGTRPTFLPNRPPLPKRNRFKAWVVTHKKLLLILLPIVAVIALSAVLWFISARNPNSDDNFTLKKVEKPVPVKVAAPLTGILVDADAAKKPIAGVMIENSTDARPQSGLSEAGVVYEAIAEGGITRFLALFQEPYPTPLGPVRSLRPYYLDWALEYNAPAVHAGGSQPALAQIGPSHLKNVEALVQGSGFYRAKDRAAPHNLYTNNDLLTKLLAKLGFDTAPTYIGWARKDDTPPATGIAPLHPKITITISSSAYNVQYDYDATTNSYKRTNGALAQVDRNTNAQISTKNVIVEFVPVSYGTQKNGKPETIYNLLGTGKAYIFMDGDAIVGTWSKTADAAPTVFLDAAGAPVKFNRGNTWVSAIPAGNAVTY